MAPAQTPIKQTPEAAAHLIRSATPDRSATSRDALHRAFVATIWLAGVFCVLVAATMVHQHFNATTNDPWKSPQLLALKDKLATDPKNEQLKQEIRKLDFEFRRSFRRRLSLDDMGGWLLLGGALVLAVAAKTTAQLRQTPYLPQLEGDAITQSMQFSRRARLAVAATGCVVVAALIFVWLAIGTVLPKKRGDWQALAGNSSAANAPVTALPTPAEFQANSPRFRGWDGSGVSTVINAPLSWDGESSAGIAWKSAIPAPGHSSPIVWNNRVMISGGTAQKREVFAYDVATGQLLWRRAVENVPDSPQQAPEVPAETGYACSTMASDGRNLYVIFANGDLAALTLDGVVTWAKSFGALRNAYGHATSLAIWQGKLVVQLDQGDGTGGGSKLVALDGGTGRVLWERSRLIPASWATPIIIEAGGKTQIITLGMPWVIAYSLEGGNEVWRAELLEGEVVPSPEFAGGLIIVASPSTKLTALRPDGAGDVTKTHIAWSTEENVPDIASPVSNGELAFTVTSGGVLTCFDVKDGGKVWEHDLQMEVQASPAIISERLFVLGVKGVAVVVEAGRQFKEASRSELPDKFLASPAFVNGRTFLRGETNLFCIASPGDAPAKRR